MAGPKIVDLSRASATRAAFARLAAGPDEAIDLVTGALLIAAEDLEDRPLDPAPHLREIDRLASRVQDHLASGTPVPDRLVALRQVLFLEAGFRGDDTDYYRLDNALLPRVLDRRRGLPLTLAILYMEVARRCEVEASGVAFPGHFLVRCEVDDGFLILDPFHRGRFLDRDACVTLLGEMTEGRMRFHPALLRPAGPRAILARLLANLRQMYLMAEDEPRALRAQDRLVLLDPDDPAVLRERGRLHARLGAGDAAVYDLERSLELEPRGPEAERAETLLRRLRLRPRPLN